MVTTAIPFFAKPWVVSACQKYQANPTRKILFLELLAINAPRTLLVRSWDEALDAGFNELGNTAGFFGGLYGGNKLLNSALKALKIPIEPNTPHTLSQGRIIKSWALLWPLAAFMFAMPFYRNAYTAKRSGHTDFERVITQNKGVQKQHTQQSAEVQAQIQRNMRVGNISLLSGLGIGLLGALLGKGIGPIGLFKNTRQLKPLLDKSWIRKPLQAFSLVDVGQQKAGLFGKWHALLFWGTPAYLGWIAAAREKLEQKEQLLKMASFYAVYALTDTVVYKLFFDQRSAKLSNTLPQLYTKSGDGVSFVYAQYQNLMKNNPSQRIKAMAHAIVQHENKRLVSGFGISLLLMATLPVLINIALTQKRLILKKQQDPITSSFSTVTTRPLEQKPHPSSLVPISTLPAWQARYVPPPLTGVVNPTFRPYAMHTPLPNYGQTPYTLPYNA